MEVKSGVNYMSERKMNFKMTGYRGMTERVWHHMSLP
jgi:hypothetical protein